MAYLRQWLDVGGGLMKAVDVFALLRPNNSQSPVPVPSRLLRAGHFPVGRNRSLAGHNARGRFYGTGPAKHCGRIRYPVSTRHPDLATLSH